MSQVDSIMGNIMRINEKLNRMSEIEIENQELEKKVEMLNNRILEIEKENQELKKEVEIVNNRVFDLERLLSQL